MFKKYKQLIIGFLLGALVFSIIPVSAAIEEFICYRADYKVMINGKEYVNDGLPILNYKGNTYAPFRSVLEQAGLNVNWNAELGQAEVTSNSSPAETQTTSVNEGKEENMSKIEKDGYNLLVVDGIEYIPINEIEDNHGIKKYGSYAYGIGYDKETNTGFLYYNDTLGQSVDKNQILLTNIPVEIIQGRTCIQYSYFKENVLELIN